MANSRWQIDINNNLLFAICIKACSCYNNYTDWGYGIESAKYI